MTEQEVEQALRTESTVDSGSSKLNLTFENCLSCDCEPSLSTANRYQVSGPGSGSRSNLVTPPLRCSSLSAAQIAVLTS